MYGYIYETRFLNHPEWVYYGKHKSKKFDENYHGSGTVVKKYIEKYGTTFLQTTPIVWCNSKKELDEKEKEIIDLGRKSLFDVCLNIANGGDGGDITIGYKWYTNGEIDIYLKNSNPPNGFYLGRARDKFKNVNKNNIWINNGVINKHILKTDLEKYPDWSLGMLDRGDVWKQNIKKARENVSEITK